MHHSKQHPPELERSKSTMPQGSHAPNMTKSWPESAHGQPRTCRSKCVSLNALLCLEVSARHSSFTKAAEELGVSVFAVSQQVRQIERRLGKPLFVRSWRSIAPTELGRRVFPLLQSGFFDLFNAIDILQRARNCQGEHSEPHQKAAHRE